MRKGLRKTLVEGKCVSRRLVTVASNYRYRPKHRLYEDIEPLFANFLFPFLVIAIANNAFRDYDSLESIFAIPAPR